METHLILPKKYDGINKGQIYHLTETSKTTAVDEFGYTWTLKHGIYDKDFVTVKKQEQSLTNPQKLWATQHLLKDKTPDEIIAMFGYDRNHNKFALYKQGQYPLAESIVNEICPSCDDKPYDKIGDIYYTIPEKINKLDDPKVIQKMNLEAEKAQIIMKYMLDPPNSLKK